MEGNEDRNTQAFQVQHIMLTFPSPMSMKRAFQAFKAAGLGKSLIRTRQVPYFMGEMLRSESTDMLNIVVSLPDPRSLAIGPPFGLSQCCLRGLKNMLVGDESRALGEANET